MLERVGKLRLLLADAVMGICAQSQAQLTFRAATVDHKPDARRAMARRQINRIADRYGWQDEIQYALDQAGHAGLKHLDTDQLETLIDHLHTLVDCIQTASDPHDAPPAR